MRDALTAFAVSDINDFTSLNTRTERENHGALSETLCVRKAAYWANAPTSPASDTISSQDQFNSAQSVTAFSELDRRRADTTEIETCLCELRAQNNIKNAHRIADRIVELLELYKEDYEGRSLSASSLVTFINFLMINPTTKFPSITATPAGELYVQWKYSESQRLGVHFLAGSEAKWVLFKRNPVYEEQIDNFTDRTGISSFNQIAIALGIHEWIAE